MTAQLQSRQKGGCLQVHSPGDFLLKQHLQRAGFNVVACKFQRGIIGVSGLYRNIRLTDFVFWDRQLQ